MSDSWLCARIAKIEALIEAIEDAQLAFAQDENVQSYRIDTGQTDQRVTRADLDKIANWKDSLLNQRAALRNRCRIDQASTKGRPGW